MSVLKNKKIMIATILLLPFIGSVTIINHFMGSLSVHGSFYPIVLGGIMWFFLILFKGDRVEIPNNLSAKLFFLYFVLLFFSFMVNFPDMLHRTYQGFGGFEKAIAQLITYILIAWSMIYIYNITKDNEQKNIFLLEKYIIYSFIIAGGYSIIEIMSIFGNPFMKTILGGVDSLFRGEQILLVRVRSVCSEASYLSMYAAFLFPWLLNGVFNKNQLKIRAICLSFLIYLLLLIFLSLSRTGYVILTFEAMIFFFFYGKDIIRRNKKILVTTLVTLCVVIMLTIDLISQYVEFSILDIFLSLLDMDGSAQSMSNIARYSSNYAALSIFLDNPFLGVGPGQFGFFAADRFPDWGWVSYEVMNWGNNTDLLPDWPVIMSLYVRLLAESGMFGFVFFLGGMIKIFMILKKKINNESNLEYKNMLISLFISQVGVLLCGMNYDVVYLPYLTLTIPIIWNLESI